MTDNIETHRDARTGKVHRVEVADDGRITPAPADRYIIEVDCDDPLITAVENARKSLEDDGARVAVTRLADNEVAAIVKRDSGKVRTARGVCEDRVAMIRAMANAIVEKVESYDLDTVDWGHAGDLGYVGDQLSEACSFLFPEELG